MTLNIPLTDNWKITSDTHNYILLKEEYGSIVYRGYFSSLKTLIQHFVNLRIRDFNAKSMEEVLNSISALEIALTALLEPLVAKKSKDEPISDKEMEVIE